MTLRVGSVPYLVGRPLDHGLDEVDGVELVREVPARLVEGLRSGRLDVALVSSIELFRCPGYGYLDGPAVCGRGFVSSVQLFLRRPVDELRHVVLDPASRTSQALVRVTLDAVRGSSEALAYEEVALGVDPSTAGGDAWLEIGDAALRRHLAPGAPPVHNPSEAWARATGLPFVFAPWIVRPGVELAPAVRAAFATAHDRNRVHKERWSRSASERWDLPLDACRRYLENECSYDGGSDLAAALSTFRDRAARLGLCDGSLTPTPIPVR